MRLTPREQEVVNWLAVGLTQREAAQQMGLSFHTVKNHLAEIYARNGLHKKTEMIVTAFRQGLVRFDDCSGRG